MFSYKVTDEVELKLLQTWDEEELFRLTDENRDYLRKWLPWVDKTVSVGDTRVFIMNSLHQFAKEDGFQSGIMYQGKLVGTIGFHPLNRLNESLEIGYWLGEKFQGKGIITSACRAMLEIGFTIFNVHRIEIRAAAENQRSRAVAKRLGFHEDGIRRKAQKLSDGFFDEVIYSMLREEWEATRK